MTILLRLKTTGLIGLALMHAVLFCTAPSRIEAQTTHVTQKWPGRSASPATPMASVPLPSPSSGAATLTGSDFGNAKTFSIVVTPKIISDFGNPLPSIQKFYDNYANLMSKFSEQLIAFYVGTGDHIYGYPAGAFVSSTQITRPLLTGNTVQWDSSSGNPLPASVLLDANDMVQEQKSYLVVPISTPTAPATASRIFPEHYGIPLNQFPYASWYWKKTGGTSMSIGFLLHNRDTGERFWIGYYAGTKPSNSSILTWPQIKIDELPSSWTQVQASLQADFYTVQKNIYKEANYEATRNWEVVGVGLDPEDGNFAHFADVQLLTNINYINWSNESSYDTQGKYLRQTGRTYPQQLTYALLKNVFAEFKAEGVRRGLNPKILDGVDPGHEFAFQPWKYERHPETMPELANVVSCGANCLYSIDFGKPLTADATAYAAYPQGIAEGTNTGDFIANQIGRYAADMNLDGIYSTNGFGLSPEIEPWLAHYSVMESARVQSFFQNLKAALGARLNVWMDGYYSPQVNYNFFSAPDSIYDNIDYIELSTFFQDGNGNLVVRTSDAHKALLGLAGRTPVQMMEDVINGYTGLKATHPNLKVLWTIYFNDPWYDITAWPDQGSIMYGSHANTSMVQAYKDALDGILIYSNDSRGNHVPQTFLAPLFDIFPVSEGGQKPSIQVFEVSSSSSDGSTTSNESFTLTWQVQGATSISIDHGVGDVTSLSSALVAPSGTTTYTLVAVNQFGSATAQVTISVAPHTQPTGLLYVPITPCRAVDTRTAGGLIPGNASRDFVIAGQCGIPAAAQAFAVNVTAVPGGPLGFLTTWPSGGVRPNASTLNSLDGSIRSNAAIVQSGTGGKVSVYVTDAAQVILDIAGYFVPQGTSDGLAFYPVIPCRLADTRTTDAPSLGATTNRYFAATGPRCGVPASAQALALNVTAVPQGPLYFLSLGPRGASATPNTSTLNAPTGALKANFAIVQSDSSGSIWAYPSNNTNLILDVAGYFAPPGPGGLSFYPTLPCRSADTRGGNGAFIGWADLLLAGGKCGLPQAYSYVLNATVVPRGPLGFLSLLPQRSTKPPGVSVLNDLEGSIISNMAIVPSVNGLVSAYTSDPTNLILDVNGYFNP